MAKNYQTRAKEHIYSSKVRVRFFVPDAAFGKEITLSGEQIRHLKVLRLSDGEKVGIFDGKGEEFVVDCSEKVRLGKVKLDSRGTARPELPVAITLAISVPKGDRMSVLVEKVSELGITNLVPIVCSRSAVQLRDAKIERFRRITIEAACQSERSIVPMISEPMTFADLLDSVKNYNQALICHAEGEPLSRAFADSASVLIIVGPEGDFTPTELDSALQAGCVKVRLGPSILRTETAGIAAVAQIAGLVQKQ